MVVVGAGLAATGAGASFVPHLIQKALHQDHQGEGDSVQAEEDIITLHGVHSIWVFEEKLLLLRGWGEAEEGRAARTLKGMGWAVVGGQTHTLMCGTQKRPTLNTL